MASAQVDWDELFLAHTIVADSLISQGVAWVSRSTGKVYAGFEDMGDVQGDIPEDVYENDDYLSIPGKFDLDLGKSLVWEFVRTEIPDHENSVRRMFSRPGAYGRYKNFLAELDLLDAWHAFEHQRVTEELIAWCETNDLEVVNIR